MAGFSFDRRIARAGELAQKHASVSQLLRFYQELARFQKSVCEALAKSEDHSVNGLLSHVPGLLAVVRQAGSAVLQQTAQELADLSHEEWLELLSGGWQPERQELSPECAFFVHALLQPQAEYLAGRTISHTESSPPLCPFCNSKPQVGVLRPEGDGAKRSLICSLCSTEWNFRRVVCPSCGEENKDLLPVFIASEFDYVRVEACDTCRTYIKSIDLSKNGHAVPVVDELASVSLNLWAQENKYSKLSPNLFGV
ncbi:MAG TPA: formate dehydrogenase accessory protein FdhE [Candidatus Angelobacter sp.]|jgi:FdhE protein|nr:formate dehydrogenase accessory protein FdhE [Candidatus Angelobacter sp.]